MKRKCLCLMKCEGATTTTTAHVESEKKRKPCLCLGVLDSKTEIKVGE